MSKPPLLRVLTAGLLLHVNVLWSPCLQVPSLKQAPAYARALFDLGIRDPSDLATAPDDGVQKAVLQALPKALRGAQAKLGAK